MKKYLLPFILLVMLTPMFVQAETCNSNDIKIESIERTKITGNAEEITEANISGKKIKLDLKLHDLGDSIEYKLKVKNDSNEKYYFEENSLILDTDYLNYEFMDETNSNMIEAGTEKTIQLKVEYKKEVPQNQLVNGSFNDTNSINLILSNNDTANKIKNPRTNNNLLKTSLLFLILLSILLMIFQSKKRIKYFILILGCSILIPSMVYAFCTYEIEVESKIQIIPTIIYPEGKNKTTVEMGDLIKIDTEEFYVVSNDGTNIVLLARYNLNVGANKVEGVEGIQNANTVGLKSGKENKGTVKFSETAYWVDKIGEGEEYEGSYDNNLQKYPNVFDSNSNIYQYVISYKEYLESLGVRIKNARLLTMRELREDLGYDNTTCSNAPEFLNETSFWLGEAVNNSDVFRYGTYDGCTSGAGYYRADNFGVRPVIVI